MVQISEIIITNQEKKNPLKKFKDVHSFGVLGAQSYGCIVTNDVMLYCVR